MSDPSPLRAQIRAVIRLAAPIAIAQVGMQAMSMVDVMMLGRVDEDGFGIATEDAMAAAGVGSTFALGLQMPAMGILMALDPLIAQAHGANDRQGVARALRRGLVLSALLALPLMAMAFVCEPLLRLFKQPESLIPLAGSYVLAVMPGVALQLFFFAFRQTLQAMHITRPVLWAVLVANAANVVLNLFFVFGWFGGPLLGVLGSGIATAISRGMMAGVVLLFAWRWLGPCLRQKSRPNTMHDYTHTLAIGAPIGMQVSLEVWVFSAVALAMGSLGELTMAGHQVAIQLAALSFMVPLAVGMAAATLVGNAIGRGDHEGARRAAWASFAVGVGCMVIGATAFVSIPELLARAYTADAEVIAMAALLLPVAAAFQLFDGAQVVCLGILRGAADTRVPALINFVGYWVLGVPVGWWLCFRMGLEPTGLWWGLTVGLGSCAVFLIFRVRRALSRKMKRVEVTVED